MTTQTSVLTVHRPTAVVWAWTASCAVHAAALVAGAGWWGHRASTPVSAVEPARVLEVSWIAAAPSDQRVQPAAGGVGAGVGPVLPRKEAHPSPRPAAAPRVTPPAVPGTTLQDETIVRTEETASAARTASPAPASAPSLVTAMESASPRAGWGATRVAEPGSSSLSSGTAAASSGAWPSGPQALAGNALPDYPSAAREDGLEGRVVLRVSIGADGRVLDVKVLQRSGVNLLDAAAREAVKRWRYRPASDGAASVPSQLDIAVRFNLRDAAVHTDMAWSRP